MTSTDTELAARRRALEERFRVWALVTLDGDLGRVRFVTAAGLPTAPTRKVQKFRLVQCAIEEVSA
jgi:hypothetical protein